METLLHNLVQATGWSILHSLWQSALIYALLLPFQPKAFKLSASIKYILAYTATCLMFVCFIMTFLSVFQWPSNSGAAHNFTDQVVSPVTIPLTLTRYVELLFPYLVLLYSLGLIIQSFIVIQGYKKVQLLKKAAYSKIPEEWQITFNQLTERLNIRKHVDFRLSGHVSVPLVIGFFKPVILFPLALAAQMDLKQVETILIHELSHIRRNDYVFNLIRTIIDTLLFFNPFIWLTGKFIDIEREHSCDDLVVKITHTPVTYAHALLKLELLTGKSTPVFALAATGKNQHLYQRIKRITDMKTNYTNSKQKLFAVTLTIATIVSLAWINPAKKDKPAKISPQHLQIKAPELSAMVPADTGKKKTKRVIVVKIPKDTSSNVYLNVPDSTHKGRTYFINSPATGDAGMQIDSVFDPQLSSAISNLAIKVKDMALSTSANQEDIKRMQADLQKQGAELQKKFNSPEQRAKLKKYAEEMQAKYNNPEERAKWEKLAREAEASANSPERKAMIIRLQKDAALHVAEAQKMMASAEFKKAMQIRINQNIPIMIMSDNSTDQKVKQSPEYIKLKQKFDKDVEDLNKKLKKDSN